MLYNQFILLIDNVTYVRNRVFVSIHTCTIIKYTVYNV